MLYMMNASATDAARHYRNVSMINCLRAPDPPAALRLLEAANMEIDDVVNYYAESNNNVAHLVVGNPRRIVVIADGAFTVGLTARWRSDFAALGSAFAFNDTPQLLIDCGNRIRLNMPRTYLEPNVQLIYIGYSTGGAAGDEFIRQCRTENGTLDTEQWDYGSPRSCPGNGPAAASYRGQVRCRMRLENDPIPFFPPWPNESGATFGMVGISVGIRWAGLAQRIGAWGVSLAGEIAWNTRSTSPSITPTLDFLSWLTGVTMTGADPHALSTYQRVFLSVVPVPVPAQPVDTIPQSVPMQPATNPPLARQQIVAANIQYAQQTTSNVAEAERIAAVTLNGPPATRCHRRKISGTYFLTVGDQCVAVTVSKRDAKRIQRDINRQLAT